MQNQQSDPTTSIKIKGKSFKEDDHTDHLHEPRKAIRGLEVWVVTHRRKGVLVQDWARIDPYFTSENEL